jgi:tetratricopeptide (TPR) repeat protein
MAKRRLLVLSPLLLLILLLALLSPTSAGGGEINDPNSSEKIAIENEIQNLKRSLERNQNSNRNLGSQYAHLGFLYQSSDVRWHNGGKYKPLALENFNKALTYDLSDKEKILILQRKGMLLKMMSKGAEAVETHQQVLNLREVSDADASEAYLHIADAQSMMGKVSEALESLNSALSLDPNNLGVYYPMVQACKELRCKTPSGWAETVQEMETALQRANSGKGKTHRRRTQSLQWTSDDDDEDEDDEPDSTVSTGIYWALYEASLKAGAPT